MSIHYRNKRMSIITSEFMQGQLKAMAVMENTSVSSIVNEALQDYFMDREEELNQFLEVVRANPKAFGKYVDILHWMEVKATEDFVNTGEDVALNYDGSSVDPLIQSKTFELKHDVFEATYDNVEVEDNSAPENGILLSATKTGTIK